MKKMIRTAVVVVMIAAGIWIPLSAQNIVAVKDFSSIPAMAKELQARHPGAQVLIAFDVDHTILRMPSGRDLGGEAWYDWQSDAVRAGALDKMAGGIDELLALQGVLFYLAPMQATDPGLKDVLAELEKAKFPMIVLTSRGSEFRFATERDIALAGFPFERTGVALGPCYFWTYVPYDINAIEASGYLNKDDVKTFELKDAMPISYRKGILLTGGQHKGIMLRSLLYRSRAKIGAILYIDNKDTQLKKVGQAFANQGIEVKPVQYIGMGDEDTRFRKDERRLDKAWSQWNALMRFVRMVFRWPVFAR
jgi:Protein of unknown function (DUF2608)